MPWLASTTTRRTFSGSTTSIRIGPAEMSMRSMFRTREACRQCSIPSRITEKWASAMLRCG